MPCEHYKDALTEVAASGAVPQGELRAHLAECASCSAAFDEEQSLFAAIDSGLHAAVNTEVPHSLLPRVRARLSEVEAPRLRWLRPLVFASVSVALVLVIFLMARPWHSAPEEVAKQSAVAAPAPAARSTETNPENVSSMGTQMAAIHAAHSHTAQNSTNIHSSASGNPEVLVPPDEREAFARFVAVLNERSDVAAALVAKAPQKDVVVTADPPQIPDIEIKPLEGTEIETSDGTGEKH